MVLVKCLETKTHRFMTALATCYDAYILRSGDFCVDNDNNNNDDNNRADYFTPCACARGKNATQRNVRIELESILLSEAMQCNTWLAS